MKGWDGKEGDEVGDGLKWVGCGGRDYTFIHLAEIMPTQ